MRSLTSRRRFLTQTAAAVTGAGLVQGAEAPSLRAGVSTRRITPPLTIPFLTSSGNGTNAPFQGVNDDLFARALVLDDGGQSIAILAVDAIGYNNTVLGPGRDFTAELRARVRARTGIAPGSLMLSATHTHQAPETIGLTPFREVAGVTEWLERHLEELADTVIEAWGRRTPVRAFAGTTKAEGIARYRRIVLKNGTISRNGALPSPEDVAIPWRLDEDLSVLCFQQLDGSPHSVLLNYTAHPVVTMLLPKVSADYPGAACALIEAEAKGAVCLFTNGAAGNINSLHVSTSFTDAEDLGQKLGRAALAEIARLRAGAPLSDTRIAARSVSLTLGARECPPLAEAEQLVLKQPNARNHVLRRLARKLAEDPLRAEIQAMRVGPVSWISLPGEPFVETGFALKEAGATFVAGYSNGWLGYFPIRRAYSEGGYEANIGTWSRVAPGSAEQLEENAKSLLGELKRSRA